MFSDLNKNISQHVVSLFAYHHTTPHHTTTHHITWWWRLTWLISCLLTRRTDCSCARSWRAWACCRRSAEEGRPGREEEEEDIICMAAPIRGFSLNICWRRGNWGWAGLGHSGWSSLVLVVMVREEGRLTGILDWTSGDPPDLWLSRGDLERALPLPSSLPCLSSNLRFASWDSEINFITIFTFYWQ